MEAATSKKSRAELFAGLGVAEQPPWSTLGAAPGVFACGAVFLAPGAQSPSVAGVQPGGQQPSPGLHSVMGEKLQAALQLSALPESIPLVQTLPSLQLAGQVSGGSQVSPVSTKPSPQLEEQSLSVAGVQPGGQQPSSWSHSVMMLKLQLTLQLSALPVMISTVQATRSSQVVGQVPGGSQVSPYSMALLPQLTEQSSSMVLSQPGGQQPSPESHSVMGACPQEELQLAGLPMRVSLVQATPSSQAAMQLEGGSQVSPCSTRPLPQLIEQSLSLALLQLGGQQPSPEAQWVMGL